MAHPFSPSAFTPESDHSLAAPLSIPDVSILGRVLFCFRHRFTQENEPFDVIFDHIFWWIRAIG